jgi:hypothetical protein
MAKPFEPYIQNTKHVEEEKRTVIDDASRQRRSKAADVTLDYLRLLQQSNQPIPDFDAFLKMQEQQKRQLRPHGSLEDGAPAHVEIDQGGNAQ